MTDDIRVSIVVPVYNPGRHIDKLIASLDAQTLNQDSFEVIFSDDGSTDGSPGRLDELAARRDNVRVRHEPNSGWPGRPRNLGTDLARGDYVFFVDQDDWLGAEALQRMCDFAEANRSDVVIGRYAGHRRTVAKAPFRRTCADATLQNTPLMDTLTPHKMFRTAFLRDKGLRFPEGRRRLEDHVFVTAAYFLAERISVLADYHCYFHIRRDDDGNAGYQRIDPAGYYGNVREVVDIVLDHTSPGPIQDRCLRRSLRTELLGRLDGKSFLDQDASYQRALFDEARALAGATMPLSVDAGLNPPQRVRAALLRANQLDDLKACVSYHLDIKPAVRLVDLHWDDDGALVVETESGLIDRKTGQPWRYEIVDEPRGERIYLTPPHNMQGPFPHGAAECTKQLRATTGEIVLRRRADSEEWPVTTESTATVHRDGQQAWATVRSTARIDVRTVGGGSPLTIGVWDAFVRINSGGFTKEARLGADRTPDATEQRQIALLGELLTRPYWTKPYDNLSIDIAPDLNRILSAEAPVAVTVDAPGATTTRSVRVVLPIFVPSHESPDATVRLNGNSGSVKLETRAERGPRGELSLVADLGAISSGTWTVLAGVGSRDLIVTGSDVAVSPTGDVAVLAPGKHPTVGPASSRANTANDKEPSAQPLFRRRLQRKLRSLLKR